MSGEARKTIGLTGASRGIGTRHGQAPSARRLARHNLQPRCDPGRCKYDPNWTDHITVDLGQPEEADRCVDEALRVLGGQPVHALVNNAAISPKTSFKDGSASSTAMSMPGARCSSSNFFTPLKLARGFAKPLHQGQGRYHQHHLDRRPRDPSVSPARPIQPRRRRCRP